MTSPLLGTSLLLRAYASGLFPMADSFESDRVLWIDPERRGVLPLDKFHIPRKLRRLLKKNPFSIRINSDFEAVVQNCASRNDNRHDTWLSPPIQAIHLSLYQAGYAHSVECWQNNQLVGGLYGIQIGGFFAGETMFSKVTHSSKIALCYLIAHLIEGKFSLLDIQFMTNHLERFGAIEIPRGIYMEQLEQALAHKRIFPHQLSSALLSFFPQSTSQTS